MVSMKEVVSSFQSFNERLAGLGPSTSRAVTVNQDPLVSAKSLPPLVLETRWSLTWRRGRIRILGLTESSASEVEET